MSPTTDPRIAILELIKSDEAWGPELGRRVCGEITSRLSPSRPFVALDMAGIAVVDVTWTREAIIPLLVPHPPRHWFFLKGASATVSDNVDMTLWRHGHCILSRQAEGEYEVLGKGPSDAALEVLAIVERQGETTARAICAALSGLRMPACNNRLHDLIGAGLVVREEGRPLRGKEFIYRRLSGWSSVGRCAERPRPDA